MSDMEQDNEWIEVECLCCDGTGFVAGEREMERCPDCMGTGKDMVLEENLDGYETARAVKEEDAI